MKLAVLLFALLFSVTSFAQDVWQRVPCFDDPSITVTMLLRPVASPADETFIGFELNNHTDQPLSVANASFRLASVEVARESDNKGLFSTGVVGGGPYDLLWREGTAPPKIGPRHDVIPPGVSSFLRYWSIYTMAVLNIPQERLVVSGRIHFDLSLAGGHNLATPRAGVPFRFIWQPPAEAQLPAMRQRLARTLAVPTEPFGDAYLLKTFLADQRLTSALTVDELLTALKVHDQVERPIIREYIDQRYPTDEKTIAFCLDTIARHDRLLIMELSNAQHIKDRRLIAPLMDWVRLDAGQTHNTHFALVMLHNHRDLMTNPKDISAELGRIVLASCRRIDPKTPKENSDKWFYWQQELGDLALTGDSNLVPVIIPYLDEPAIVFDARMDQVLNNGVSTRACDIAYNTLLDLLGRPGTRFSTRSPMASPSIADENARRDALIKKLKTELAAPAPAR